MLRIEGSSLETMFAEWQTSQDYSEAAIAEFATINDPINPIIDSAGYTYGLLGTIDFIVGDELRKTADVAKAAEGAERIARSAENFEQMLTLAQHTGTDGAMANRQSIFHVYIAALCSDGQTDKAQERLAEFTLEFPDPEAVRAQIIGNISPDIWAQCASDL